MDFVFEFIFELIAELGFELATNKKVSKFIRYPILLLYILLFCFVIFLILFMGISIIKESIIGGILIILLGVFLLFGSIIKLRKLYIEKFRSKQDV